MNRREAILSSAAALALPSAGTVAAVKAGVANAFPPGFLWGAATAGHQVEGNNTASDTWYLEQVKPTAFAEPSGDACNSFELWATDLDLVQQMGLNTYRFSIEWARIEPEPGQFSLAMLDHYLRMIEGCRQRGLTPVVTFNHFTSPRWFAMRGGWLDDSAPDLFARYCDRAARHLGAGIGYALTFNEPDLMALLKWVGLPPPVIEAQRAMLVAAARAAGTPAFFAANAMNFEDIPRALPRMIAGHKAGKAAIKAAWPRLPVGLSLAVVDDQAVGNNSRRDEKRAEVYGAWLEAVRGDDFVGVQNYERSRLDAKGPLPPPVGARLTHLGAEVYPPSLAGAVRYVHSVTGCPVMVTEHGVGTDDDTLRAWLIPAALQELRKAMDEGVPVLGYVHWSLLDNFEWIFGYGPKYGLHTVDRKTFERKAKPSAVVLGNIAKRNSLQT
jgi:beta-glucosidase